MALTIEELSIYTTLVIELKRLEEMEKDYNLKTQALFEEIRDKYNYTAMQDEIAALADLRSVELKAIQDKIEAVRQELIV